MKTIIILITLLLLKINVNAQINCMSDGPVYLIDSLNFDSSIVSSKMTIQIDTANHQNIWQVGKVTKTFFTAGTIGG